MQTGLIEHYLTEILQDWLSGLSQKFPMSPLSAVLSNYLMFPEDGTETSRLHIVAHQLYQQIKMLEDLPDDVAFVPEGEEVPTAPAFMPNPNLANRVDVV